MLGDLDTGTRKVIALAPPYKPSNDENESRKLFILKSTSG